MGRRQRQRFNFPLRPIWAEVLLSVVGCAAVLGAVAVLNAYYMPINLAKRYAEAHNIPWPAEGQSEHFVRHLGPGDDRARCARW